VCSRHDEVVRAAKVREDIAVESIRARPVESAACYPCGGVDAFLPISLDPITARIADHLLDCHIARNNHVDMFFPQKVDHFLLRVHLSSRRSVTDKGSQSGQSSKADERVERCDLR